MTFFLIAPASKLEGLLKTQELGASGGTGHGQDILAKRLAYLIAGKKDDSRINIVQFHQSYSYEDWSRATVLTKTAR